MVKLQNAKVCPDFHVGQEVLEIAGDDIYCSVPQKLNANR